MVGIVRSWMECVNKKGKQDMAFRILDEEELLFLDEQERASYEEELSLYYQRCALAEQIERSEQPVHVEPFIANLNPISPVHTIDNKELVFAEPEVSISIDSDVDYNVSSYDFVYEEKIDVAVPKLELTGNIETRTIQELQLQKIDAPSVSVGDVNIKHADVEIDALDVNADFAVAEVRRPEMKTETPVINVWNNSNPIQAELNIVKLSGYSGINDIELHEKDFLPEVMIPIMDKEETIQLDYTNGVITPNLDIKMVTEEVNLTELNVDITLLERDYSTPVLSKIFMDKGFEVTVGALPIAPSLQVAAVTDYVTNVQISVPSDIEEPLLYSTTEIPELELNCNVPKIQSLSVRKMEAPELETVKAPDINIRPIQVEEYVEPSVRVSEVNIDLEPIQTREYHAQSMKPICVSMPEEVALASIKQVENRKIKVDDIYLENMNPSIHVAEIKNERQPGVRIKAPVEVVKTNWSTGIQNLKQTETSVQHENVEISINTPKVDVGTVVVDGIFVHEKVTLPDAGNVWDILLMRSNVEV